MLVENFAVLEVENIKALYSILNSLNFIFFLAIKMIYLAKIQPDSTCDFALVVLLFKSQRKVYSVSFFG